MAQTAYVEVQANSVSTFSVDIPSGTDTTSGYYITYEIAETAEAGGGFTGHGWFWDIQGNPLQAAGLNSFSMVEDRYNSNGGNLNDVFGSWITNIGEDNVHSFCVYLWSNARNCISMVG